MPVIVEWSRIKWLLIGMSILMYLTESRATATAPPSLDVPTYSTENKAKTEKNGQTAPIQFKIVLAGEIEDEDGVHLAITNYLASDGVGVTVIHGELTSNAAVQEYLEKVLAKALKVTERGDEKDSQGNVVGKRAKAIVRTGTPNEPIPALLFTYGKDFYEIQCDSSRHSQIMEKRLTSKK